MRELAGVLRRPLSLVILLALVACLLVPQSSRSADAAATQAGSGPPLAFKGAEGYGRFAAGGRYGKVIAVTTLADGGPGSLRACIEASGPRVCIFRVAGVIRFTTLRPIIFHPYLTIAGQTAPGGGIVITHNGGPDAFTPLVVKDTHDIIIRDIRVRPDKTGKVREANSAYVIQRSSNVIFDHVSGSWARDENMGLTGQNDSITISWSIFAEGIPRHDKCALLGDDPTGPQHVSFIKNICAHNGDRNPDINFEPSSCVEIINNILYDAQSEYAEIWEEYGGTPVSIVGNYFKAGPSTKKGAPAILRHIGFVKNGYVSGQAAIYLSDNYFDRKLQAQSAGVSDVLVNGPICPLQAVAMPVDQAFEQVLAGAGAFPRDSFDAQIVQDVKDRTGHIIHEPGALPEMAPGTPYVDSDGDGMSDDWERANGTNPNVFDAWGDHGDGRTNLEAFLDYAHEQLMKGLPVK